MKTQIKNRFVVIDSDLIDLKNCFLSSIFTKKRGFLFKKTVWYYDLFPNSSCKLYINSSSKDYKKLKTQWQKIADAILEYRNQKEGENE